MNRFNRDSIVSLIVSLVLAWITEFPFPYRITIGIPTIQFHPLNFLIDFVFWFLVSLTILSVIDWAVIRDEHRNKQASRIEASLGVSFATGVVAVLGTLYGLQFAYGEVNDFIGIIPGLAAAAAIAYFVIFTKSFGSSIKGALLRLGRNLLVALLGGFVFTLATSSFYGNALFSLSGSEFWNYLHFLTTGILLLWFSVALIVTSAFNIYYSQSQRADSQSETLAKSA